MTEAIITKAEHATMERKQLSKVQIGFWIYLMSDMMLFATLFAAFVVLRSATMGASDSSSLFSLPYVYIETLLLLVSSVTSGVAYLGAMTGRKTLYFVMMIATIGLGIGFLAMELTEFAHLAADGHSWQTSGFLSGYFTLVATHGLHILIGLLWAISMVVISVQRGLTKDVLRKLGLFSLFWHFLDLIWIFIFSIVYLMGVAS